jgi:hypothetical protein
MEDQKNQELPPVLEKEIGICLEHLSNITDYLRNQSRFGIMWKAEQVKRWLRTLAKRNRKYEDILKQAMMVARVQEDQLVTSILETQKSNFGKILEIEGLQKERKHLLEEKKIQKKRIKHL